MIVNNTKTRLENNNENHTTKNLHRFFGIFIFLIECICDLQSMVCLTTSFIAGCLYATSNFLDQKISVDFFAHGNATLKSNGTFITTANDQDVKNYPLISKNAYIEKTRGNFSYDLQNLITQEDFIFLSSYAIVFSMMFSGISNLLRTCSLSLKDQMTKKSNQPYAPTTKEYFLSAIQGSINSLQLFFLGYLLLVSLLSLYLSPGEVYRKSYISQNGTKPFNTTSKINEGITTSQQTGYDNNFFNEIRFKTVLDNSISILIKSDISVVFTLNALLSYAVNFYLTNQGQEPRLTPTWATIILTSLIVVSRVFYNASEHLRKERLIGKNETKSNNYIKPLKPTTHENIVPKMIV